MVYLPSSEFHRQDNAMLVILMKFRFNQIHEKPVFQRCSNCKTLTDEKALSKSYGLTDIYYHCPACDIELENYN